MTDTPPNERETPVESEEAAPPQSPDAEELDEEPRNLILALVSEIRIGMDLSRITLPTFILEPRSMLEKITDFMTHGEILALYEFMHLIIHHTTAWSFDWSTYSGGFRVQLFNLLKSLALYQHTIIPAVPYSY